MNISDVKFLLSATDLSSCPNDTVPEFAFAGRSNVGKSSLLNFLVGQRELARVSATPGHTKQINLYSIGSSWRLVDLPGYGFAQVERKEKSRFNGAVTEYLAFRENLRCVFTLVDSSLGPQAIDLEFLEGLADRNVPTAIVFTKIDKLNSVKVESNIQAFKERLSEWCENLPEIYRCSSVTLEGRWPILGLIDSILKPEQKVGRKPKAVPKPIRW